MATDGLGPSNAPDDDGLETPQKIFARPAQHRCIFACLCPGHGIHSFQNVLLQTDFQNPEGTHEQAPGFKIPLTALSLVARRSAAK